MDNLAVSTALFEGHDMAVAFDEIARAGLHKAEPAFIAGYSEFNEDTLSESNAKQLTRLAAGSGLTIAAVSAHMDIGRPGDATVRHLERRIRFVSACDCKVLITNAGLAADLLAGRAQGTRWAGAAGLLVEVDADELAALPPGKALLQLLAGGAAIGVGLQLMHEHGLAPKAARLSW